MKISTKGRYALRVMVDLAQQDPKKYIPLKEIALRQDISEKYLEILIKQLSRNKLVEGLRGKGGGYRLTRNPKDYNILEILEIMEGDLAPVACLACKENDCDRQSYCKTLPLWSNIYQVIRDYFGSFTLSDLVESNLDEKVLISKKA